MVREVGNGTQYLDGRQDLIDDMMPSNYAVCCRLSHRYINTVRLQSEFGVSNVIDMVQFYEAVSITSLEDCLNNTKQGSSSVHIEFDPSNS